MQSARSQRLPPATAPLAIASTSSLGNSGSPEAGDTGMQLSGRRQKHICVIPVRGDPCKACSSRKRPCTFDDPPTTRVRKAKADIGSSEEPERDETVAVANPRETGLAHTSSSSTSPFSLVSSVLDLVRTGRETPRATGANLDAPLSDLFGPANNDGAEQTYVSSTAFSDLTFSVAETHESRFPGDVGFRQVSSDPAMPVFFISPPTLMYGFLAPESQRLWQSACSVLGPGAPQRLIEIYLSRSQPALPVLSMQTFAQTDPTDLAAKGVSYALLTSLIAHATSYIYEIRSVHKHLWRQVILPLEDEFRKPSLHTIQTAIVILTSRPAINVAQNHIAMGRVVTAAQLLGLHLDPSAWRVSASERSLRKRLWWSLLIHDKWRTLWYGRPRTIAADDWSVPMPTLADMELPDHPSPAQKSSAESYIAWCRLTAFLDPLITDFYTVRATVTSRSVEERLAVLEKHGLNLRGFEAELPQDLRDLPSSDNKPTDPAASGVRSFQLGKLGVEMTLLRLTTATFERPTPVQVTNAARATLGLSHVLVEFLEQLLPAEFDMFWAPYCSFIISAAGAHLLRTAIAVGTLDATLRTTAGVLFARLVVTLTSSHHAAHWDVASLALDRIATLLRSLDGQLPELAPLLQLFGAPNHAPSTSTAVPPPSSPQPSHSYRQPQQQQQRRRDSAQSTSAAPLQPVSFLSPHSAAAASLPFLDGAGGRAANPSADPDGPPVFQLPTSYQSPPAAASSSFLRPPPPPPPPAASLPLSSNINGSSLNLYPLAQSPHGSTTSIDHLDPLWWMNTDILSLPDHFGTLPDLFDQAILGAGGGAFYGSGGGVVQGEEGSDVYDRPADGTSTSIEGQRPGDANEDERESEQERPMTGLDAIATAAAAAGNNLVHMPMIGANGLFDLRGFLENGGLSSGNASSGGGSGSGGGGGARS
ncbi:hypothetical protein JCM10908_001316 [Rhodotorula pacifica]|uniref:fungal specific transcription factor domain-containing protein n=1 Tax=Rhodotorula pacifica TaxID=1495444 RepID=UPI00318127E1